MTRLRAALDQETIVASPDGYALTASVDSLRFEQLLGAPGPARCARGCKCRG